MNQELSRRSFVGAATVLAGAVAGAAVTAHATESPAASEADEAPAADPELLSCDVCVVGAGPSGLTAAVAAATEGARVIVVEKRDGLGMTGHSITAVGTPWQEELGITMTPEELVDFWMSYPDPHQDRGMLLFLARESAATVDWLGEHGIEFVGVSAPPTNPFQEPMRTMVTTGDRDGIASYLTPLLGDAEARGVEVRFGVEALSLVTDEAGSVCGMEAVAADGHPVTVDAGAVVLGSGGFGSNYDLMFRYSPFNGLGQQFQGHNTGFAVTAGTAVGAQLVMPGGCTRSYTVNSSLPSDNEGRAMMVTPEGKRFVNENRYFSEVGYAGAELGFSMAYRLYDQALIDTLASEGISVEGIEAACETGAAFKAQSIEELASQLGMNAHALRDTVETYNAACDSGVDEEFGKPATRTGKIFDPAREVSYMPVMIDREYTLLNPVRTAPFYAFRCESKCGGSFTITHGGLKIDTDGQVYSCLDEPIPGLYAAGEAANGQFLGKWYPQSGTSLCICFTIGRYAGKAAALSVL